MKANDLVLLNSVSRPSIHPDGSHAVLSVTHPDIAADATVGQLWSVPLDGSGPRRITRGFRDTDPAFSEDGYTIAFLRAAAGTPAQLFVVNAAGGEPLKLTDAKLGVSEFHWSNDGSKIAYIARVPEPGRYGTVEGLVAAAEPARQITAVRYKANAVGYIIDRRSQVFAVAVPPLSDEPLYEPAPRLGAAVDAPPLVPESVQLTSGDFDHHSPRFFADDRRLAFVSARHNNRDSDLRSQVWAVAVSAEPVSDSDTKPEPLTDVSGPLSVLTFELAADGALFLIAQDMGVSGTDFVGRNASLYLHDDAGTRILTDPETIDLGEVASHLTLLSDGTVLAQNRARGTHQLLAVQRDGTVRPLSTGPVEIQGHDAAADRIVVTFSGPETCGDLAILHDGALLPITDFSTELRAAGLLAPAELTVTGREGNAVHGWVLLPAGAGPHPVLLMIHGGPFAQYSVHVLDEAQVYAAAGYAVVYCNPRGSAGYGQAHGRAIQNRMGTLDMHDVLDFFDGALDAYPSLDRERSGVLGGSYGGYLTAWIIANDHRFTAAIVERGYLDPEAFVGSSDIGWFFPREYNGSDPVLIRDQSPQAVAHQVTTPTLIIHSEEDLRCPLAQAERYFATLKANGVTAEFLVFPGENHELSRSGRPRHRVQRFEAILDWFARQLPAAP